MSRRSTPTLNIPNDPRAVALAAALAALLGGCAMTRTYEGHTRDEVWQAMVSAATHPRYRDWVVMDNQVWTDEPDARVEIWRELKRDVVLPGQKPYREEAEWRLRSSLEPGAVPVVRFATSDLCIPAHFWLQADHYFDEVQSRLAVPAPAYAVPHVPMDDDPMLLPPSSVTADAVRSDDILDSVPPADAPPAAPPPPLAPPRPSGQSQPVDIP